MAPSLSPILAAGRAAPSRTAVEILAGRGALVVLAPHPDDETLGCGALLHDAVAAGVICRVVCLTNGAASHPNSPSWSPERLARTRRAELEAALESLGAGIALTCLGYPDSDLPDDDDVLRRVEADMPEDAVLAATWAGDPHIDHERTARIAARIAGGRPDLALLSYPIWGRFGAAAPDRSIVVLRASDTALAAKRAALACHATQMTRLIADDPEGFVMPEWQQEHFLDHPEVFLAA